MKVFCKIKKRYFPHLPRRARWGPLSLSLALLLPACVSLTQAFHPVEQLGYRVVARDTKWKAGAPHEIDRNLMILPGVTLTLEPGAEVILGPGISIFCQGRIRATGEPGRPVRFRGVPGQPWGKIDFFGTAFPQDSRGGNLLRHCTVEGGQGVAARTSVLTVEHCVFRHNVSTPVRMEFSSGRIANNRIYANSTELDAAGGNGGGIVAYTDKEVRIEENVVHDNVSSGGSDGGGGIYAYAYDRGTVLVRANRVFRNASDRHGGGIVAYGCEIRENWIFENRAEDSGGGIYASSAKLVGNRVERNRGSRGGGVLAENSILERNAIVGNTSDPGQGGGLYCFGESRVVANTFVENGSHGPEPGESVVLSGNAVFNRNNLLASRGLALRAQSHALSKDLDASENFWGTQDEKKILHRIHDWFEDSELGIVNWKGFRTEWVMEAPLPPPMGLLVRTEGNRLSLSWDYPSGITPGGFRLAWSASRDFEQENLVDLPGEARRVQVHRPGQDAAVFGRLCVLAGATETNPEGACSGPFEMPPADMSPGRQDSNALQVRPQAPGSCDPSSGPVLSLVVSSPALPSGSKWAKARWVVREDPGDFALPIFDSGPVPASDAFPLPESALPAGSGFAWRAAFQDEQGNWTEWSRPTHFCTPARPTGTLSGPLEGNVVLGGKGTELISVLGNVLVPSSASVTILPGTTLDLSPGSTLRIRGRMVARGTRAEPVRFTGDPEQPWGRVFFERIDPGDQPPPVRDSSDENPVGILAGCIVEHGHGIVIEGAGPDIQDCVIRNNASSGISVHDAAVRIQGNRILENRSASNGGGIYAYGSKPVSILKNEIRGNRAAEDGGGVFAYGYRSTTAVHVEGNLIEGNRAEGDGAGVWASRSSVAGNRILSNQCLGSGGGVYATFALVEDNEIRGNQALRGGGVYGETNSSLTHNRILENVATEGLGGGAFLNFWGVSIENEEFRKNLVRRNRAEGSRKVGGIYLNGSMIFEENQIFQNDGIQLYNANPAEHAPLEAKNCYWGSAKPAEILAGIHDARKDARLALVEFEPFARSPADAPVP